MLLASTKIVEAIIWGDLAVLRHDHDIAVRAIRGSLGTLWEVEIYRPWALGRVLVILASLTPGPLVWIPPDATPDADAETIIMHYWEDLPRSDQGRRVHSNSSINSPPQCQPN